MSNELSNKKVMWERKNKMKINGNEYSSIKEFFETSTPYSFSDYNSFRTVTGIKIKDTFTANQFIEYMIELKKKPQDTINFPLIYKNKKFSTLKDLFLFLKCTRNDYYAYKRLRSKAITNSEDIPLFVEYLKTKKKTNKKITVKYKGVTYSSLTKLIETIGYKKHNYDGYRKKTGNTIKTQKDVKEFIKFMEEKEKNKTIIHYDNFDFRSEHSLCSYLGLERKDYLNFKNHYWIKKIENEEQVNKLIQYVEEKRGVKVIPKEKRILPDYRLKSEKTKQKKHS